MLDRIKRRQFDGFKEFVINMETTGGQKRGQIFTAGVLEDPVYMGWVMKNLRTFEDFLQLDSDDIDSVLASQEQVIGIFAKCLHGAEESKIMSMESVIPRFFSRFKDELSYIGELTAQEKEGARYYILKLTRKMQMEEKINGFSWQLPSQDLFYPKTNPDGKGVIHFENGTIAAEGQYSKNKRLGYWRHNYDSGQILAEGDYLDGYKAGVWVFYYSNGNIKAQGKYVDDMKHGLWKEFDRDGNLNEVEYKEGVKV